MTLEEAIRHCEEVAKSCRLKAYDIERDDYKDLEECAAEHRQLAEWLKMLKRAKFEYDEAWRTITHPTPDVTYADKQRAQVILDKFRNSLGRLGG